MTIFFTQLRHDILQRFEVDAALGHFRCLLIFSVKRGKPSGVAFRLIDALGRVTLSLADRLLRFTARPWHFLIVLPVGNVDRLLALLLRLIDLVEGGLNRLRRIDVFQLHLVNVDTHRVFVNQGLKLRETLRLDFLPPDSDHFIDGSVSYHFAHH